MASIANADKIPKLQFYCTNQMLKRNSKMIIVLKKVTSIKFLARLPSTIKFRLIRFIHEKILFKSATKEAVFTSIWRNNYWGNSESVSGVGSTLAQTEELRRNLPIMFCNFKITSVFDAPCGDMNWMRHLLNKVDVAYLGGDIVSELIEKNNEKYSSQKVKFAHFDITSDPFPVSDVWLCRAALYHLSNRDIYLALEKFLESDIKYVLTTNCVTDDNHINRDILTGDWRSLNLMLYPFNFPKKTLWEIDDFVDPHPPMKLCLWTREQIEIAMPELRKIYKR